VSLAQLLHGTYTVKEDSAEVGGLLLRGSRFVIPPPPLRNDMLKRIDEGHMGITKCRVRTRECVWWPGISMDIEQLVKICPECIKAQPHRHETLLSSEFPTRPWQIVAMDLLKEAGKWYLVVEDSRYPEFARLESLTS